MPAPARREQDGRPKGGNRSYRVAWQGDGCERSWIRERGYVTRQPEQTKDAREFTKSGDERSEDRTLES